jgi:tetratricopeptide (TPR) repeat protein
MLLDFAHARPEIDAAARMSSDFGPAAATLEAAINGAILEQDPARRLVVLGRGLGLVDEWALAVAEFERGVQADPQSAEAWAWLGEAEQHVGQDGGPELEKAMLLDPQSGLVHALEGLYLRRKGRDSEAFAEYARAAEMEPHDPALQVLLGQANTANGDLVAALAAYQRATALAPADATYWRMLALFCDDNGVQPLEIGLPAAARAVELAPKDPQALDALGWTYAQTGYAYRAEQTLLEALRQMPLPIAHLHLGQLYLRMGESSKAQEQLNLVVQFDGSGPVGRSAAELLAHYFP